jgi:hypothetical protein
MPYVVEQTGEGVRIVFSRKGFSRAISVTGGITVALWVGYFNIQSRHWYYLIWPAAFLAIFAASFMKKEAIEVDHEYLSRCLIISGMHWTTRYKLSDVLNPHYEPENGDGRNKAPSMLVFECNGKAKGMLAGVNPSEVEAILTEIIGRFPELATRWKTSQQLYGSTDVIGLNI